MGRCVGRGRSVRGGGVAQEEGICYLVPLQLNLLKT